jgi:hypothetical protein
MEEKKRVNVYIDAELFSHIESISQKESRSLNATMCQLLQQAVKERLRKRKTK